MNRLCIVVCDNLKNEADAVLECVGWEDVTIACFHTDCMRPAADRDALSATLDNVKARASEVHLISGPCLTSEDLRDSQRCRFYRLQQCFEMVAGKSIIDAYTSQGAHLLTPGWLAQWRSHLDREGFSQSTAREFFEETARKLVLLDTGVVTGSSDNLRQFAEYVGRPFETVPIGTDYMQTYLSKMVLEWRLKNEIDQTRTALAGANRRNADYATALDFIGSLTRATSEAEAVEKMLSLFTVLFSPGHLSYLPEGPNANRHSSSEVSQDPRDLLSDWAWTKSGKGFLLRICHQNDTFGVVEVDDLKLPEYKEQYLNLCLELRGVLSLSIAIARSYQRLAEAMGQLRAANEELEAFSYSISHDLRAPLRSLDGFSHILLEDYGDKLDERGKGYLNHIKASSQLMAELIDDILRLSRVGRTEMKSERVDLSDLARSVAEELRLSHPEHKAELVISPNAITEGDRSLLRIVLQNLLENAWKYTSKVGVSRIEFGATTVSEEKVYFVRDNGVGFNMEYAEKLFKPFQRLHSDREYPGTGIGLAIVQRIIARHGGKVWAEGKVGEGATFYFSLTSDDAS